MAASFLFAGSVRFDARALRRRMLREDPMREVMRCYRTFPWKKTRLDVRAQEENSGKMDGLVFRNASCAMIVQE